MGTPSLSYKEILEITKVELELIPYPDMFIIFEKGTRNHVSYISNKYIKTNKKYLKSYDPKQESKHIIYLNANTLYNYAMSISFLTIGFK